MPGMRTSPAIHSRNPSLHEQHRGGSHPEEVPFQLRAGLAGTRRGRNQPQRVCVWVDSGWPGERTAVFAIRLTAANSRRLTVGVLSLIHSIFSAGLRLEPGPREVFGGRVKEK